MFELDGQHVHRAERRAAVHVQRGRLAGGALRERRRRWTTTGSSWARAAIPTAQQCGWLKDRFGVSWQVIPTAMEEMFDDPESAGDAAGHERHAADEEAGHRRAGARVRRRGLNAASSHRRGRAKRGGGAAGAAPPLFPSAPAGRRLWGEARRPSSESVPMHSVHDHRAQLQESPSRRDARAHADGTRGALRLGGDGAQSPSAASPAIPACRRA